jgi:hypothetical protein
VDEQGGLAPVFAFDPRDQARPLRMRLDHRGGQPDLTEQPGDVLGRLPLPGPGVIPRVRRVDPDQVAANPHDLLVGRWRGVLRHLPILAPCDAWHVVCSMVRKQLGRFANLSQPLVSGVTCPSGGMADALA